MEKKEITLGLIKRNKTHLERCIKKMLQEFHDTTEVKIVGIDLEILDVGAVGEEKSQQILDVNIDMKF